MKVTSPKGGEAQGQVRIEEPGLQGLLHLREIRDGFIENLEDPKDVKLCGRGHRMSSLWEAMCRQAPKV